MELIMQVCSLGLAKRLKELNVKQESLFYHCMNYGSYVETIYFNFNCPIRQNPEDNPQYISAFTVAELGTMLPETIKIGDDYFYMTMNCDKHVYYSIMDNSEEYWNFNHDDDDNEANSRAKMLIHLIEHNILKLPK